MAFHDFGNGITALVTGGRHAPLAQHRQNATQLLVPDQRFAADDRHLHRPMTLHEFEHTVDERIAAQIAEAAQHHRRRDARRRRHSTPDTAADTRA